MNHCYLIHFDSPVAKRFRHYLGYTSNLAQRWGDHKAGHGADLTKLAVRQGVGMTLARVWPHGTKQLEFELKKRNHFAGQCPVCMSKAVADSLAGN